MKTIFLHSASGIARCPWLTGPASSGLLPSSATVSMAAPTFSRAWPSPVKLQRKRRQAIDDNVTAAVASASVRPGDLLAPASNLFPSHKMPIHHLQVNKTSISKDTRFNRDSRVLCKHKKRRRHSS